MPVAADAGIRLGVSRQHSGSPTDTMVFAPPVEWVLTAPDSSGVLFCSRAEQISIQTLQARSEFPALS